MNSILESRSHRRGFLRTAGAMSMVTLTAGSRQAYAVGEATVLETKVISHQPEYYHGWPTLTRRKNGELWVSWSGGRAAHVCPFGQVHAMSSKDDGDTWTWPRVLLDGAIDDRDSGVMETDKGTLIVTTFTSLAYESYLEKGQRMSALGQDGWQTKGFGEAELSKWTACHNRLTAEERQAELGQWIIRSEDGGKSWSDPRPITFGLPSHLLRLRDDRLLMSYGHRRPPFGNQARISSDHGQTWSEPMIISGDGIGGDLGYPSTVELADGSLLTVWYETMKEPKLAVLRQARWKIR